MALRQDFIASALGRAERQIALLDACVPLNGARERQRILQAWECGRELTPHWVLPKREGLAEIRRQLDDIARTAEGHPLGLLYVGRAEELSLEAALVHERGSREFARLAQRRYQLGADEEKLALEVALKWLGASGTEQKEELLEARHLKSALRRRIEELGLQARVQVHASLSSIAAVGDGVVFVSQDARYCAAELERIVLHEVEGHLVPRDNARRERWGIFRVGTKGAGEDEEGRALLLEERAGFLKADFPVGAGRRRELALRHRAAHAVRSSAEFVEVMHLLLDAGAPKTLAYRICERAFRGGGLAREACYLPALARVRRAFSAEPSLENWLRRGRLSVDAARFIAGQGSAAGALRPLSF